MLVTWSEQDVARKNIASRRKSQNFRRKSIATLVGVSRQAVSKWEKELSSPSTFENIIRLAEILRVSKKN